MQMYQLELPGPIPWNSVESDLGCTSRINFDNVMLTIHDVTLASQKSYQHVISVIADKQTVRNEVYFFK